MATFRMTSSTRTAVPLLIFATFCYVGESLGIGRGENLEKTSRLDLTKPSQITKNCECGKFITTQRILGGAEVTPGQKYPFMALIRKNQTIFGGTLLNDRYVLTSARQVNGSDPSELEVFLGLTGKYNLTMSSPAGVVRIKRHGSFNISNPTSPFDMALLRLKQTVVFSPKIQPICLPKYVDDQYTGTFDAVVMGWGSINDAPEYPGQLMETKVKAISTYDCQKTSLGAKIVKETMCATRAGGGSVLKKGDFGGPLVFVRGPTYVQMGVASFQSNASLPDVYTYVKILVPWIHNKTSTATYCSNPIAKY